MRSLRSYRICTLKLDFHLPTVEAIYLVLRYRVLHVVHPLFLPPLVLRKSYSLLGHIWIGLIQGATSDANAYLQVLSWTHIYAESYTNCACACIMVVGKLGLSSRCVLFGLTKSLLKDEGVDEVDR